MALLLACCALMGAVADVCAQDVQIIVTEPPGVTVRIDGDSRGSTGDNGRLAIYIPAGTHRITLEKEGYRTRTEDIQVSVLSERYTYTLERAGQVISTIPAGVTVSVDGAALGRTGADGTLAVDMSLGDHTIRLVKDGFVTISRTITVAASSTVFSFTLEESVSLGWFGRLLAALKTLNWIEVLLGAMLTLSLLLGGALVFLLVRRRRPRERTALIPSSFDRYEVMHQLGKGGMATVYLARDRTLNQEVALKVMDAGLLGDPDLVRKFVKEGEALQKIAASSPSAPVVRALRYGREHNNDSGRPFVALEYLKGSTLLKLIRQKGPLPVQHVLSVARQVSEGLAAAHAHGIWHRDISPDNVFMTGEDNHGPTIKLIDFGVAKHEFTQVHTLDGSIAGKPAYMSPEQCRGEHVDGRTDLYSVGVMMYTLLTGHPPFTDANPLIVMRLHENAPPPPLPTSVPQPVAALVYRLLNKNPDDRPSTASELAVELYALERMN